jgi:hypothetical protein
MASREPSRFLSTGISRTFTASKRSQCLIFTRNASGQAASDVESASSLGAAVPESIIKSYDPIARASARKGRLPPGRYVYLNPLKRSIPSDALLTKSRRKIDTNSALPNTTEDPFTPISRLPPQTLLRDSTSRALSLFLASSRPTILP